MTYIFINMETGDAVRAYGSDIHILAIDLDLPAGHYMVYSTDLMPDQVAPAHIKYHELKYVTTITILT